METYNRSLSDFQDKWEELVDKGYVNYNLLTPDERIWFNVESLITSVDNGGLISHYYNSGADKNKETIEDLITLGFPDVANLLTQINSWFPGSIPPADIEERNDVISNWEDGKYDELLDGYDNEFYIKEKELETKLIKLIETRVLIK